jgi:hypothetical protein
MKNNKFAEKQKDNYRIIFGTIFDCYIINK